MMTIRCRHAVAEWLNIGAGWRQNIEAVRVGTRVNE